VLPGIALVQSPLPLMFAPLMSPSTPKTTGPFCQLKPAVPPPCQPLMLYEEIAEFPPGRPGGGKAQIEGAAVKHMLDEVALNVVVPHQAPPCRPT
jgi:hypothetical protein